MRFAAAVAALVVATAVSGPAGAATAPAAPPPPVPPLPARLDLHLPAHPVAGDLARATGVVTALTARAAAQAAAVDAAAGRLLAQRLVVRDAQERSEAAQQALSTAVRTAYVDGGGGDRLVAFLAGVSPQDTGAVELGMARALSGGSAVLREARRTDRLAAAAAAAVRAEQDHLVRAARPGEALLAQAQQALDQARVAFATDAAAQALLAAQQAALASASQRLAYAVTPAVTARGQAAAAAQAPVIDLLEHTPFGALPGGYTATGDALRGDASWYGPGFVGHSSSSGSPYDPQQLTCAMLAVPLGTVVRVTNLRTGRALSLLVTDHGPYVDGRIIDLSERAAQLLGIRLGPVSVEPLQRS